MAEQDTYTLAASSNAGRYALDTADGPDLTSGRALAIRLAGEWIEGRIEHATELYVNRGLHYLGDRGPESRTIEGYYFIARKGGTCGLCVGMEVKLI